MKNIVPLSILAFFMLTNTVPVSAQYCASKSNAPWELWIKNVQLNTLNNASEKYKDYSTLGYSDFTNLNTTLTKGQTYPLSITAGLSWSGILNNAYCRTWIDWNGNAAFEDSELVLEKTNQQTFTQSLLVPTSAVTANVRMRIAVKLGGSSTSCGVFESGEVEDYTVAIAEATGQMGSDILKILNATAASSVSPNDTVAVTFTIKNVGTTPNSSDKKFKLSTGTSYSGKRSSSYQFEGFTNDVPIGIVIPPDSTRTITRKFKINADYSPQLSYRKPYERYPDGTYIGQSSANYFSSISSLYDTLPARLTLNVLLPYADLAVTMSTATPVYADKAINYVVKVKNKSSNTVSKVEARLFNLGFYTFDSVFLAPTKGTTVAYNSVGEVYTIAGYWYVGSLAPNEEATCAVFLSAPYLGLENGSGTMTADVQSLTRFDTISANNTANLSFKRDTVNKPDLTLANLTSPLSIAQGQILYYKFDAKNVGAGNATLGFTIKSYLSKDTILDANDYQDGRIQTANYLAGTNITQIQGAMTVNSRFPIGNYYLILKIDADNEVRESNEDNNVLVSSNSISVISELTNTCRFQDSLQLVSIYNATNGANWRNKWDLNTPMNGWYGVRLNGEGCAAEVDLSDNNLVGQLPNLSISKLDHLFLQRNQLIGNIPNFNCPELRLLYLFRNQFTGAIPNFNYPKLYYLSLFSNQLSGSIPNFDLPDLHKLELSENKLTGNIPNFILPKLDYLSLSSNQLSGTIPNFELPDLRELFILDNNLTGFIPNFNLTNLQRLSLFNNKLSGAIPNFNLPNLIYLNLSKNQLSGTIPNFNLPNIVNLYLGNNQLSGCIPAYVKTLCGKNVDFSENPNLETQNFTLFCTNNTGSCINVGGGTGGGNGTNDIALSLISTPSVYRQYMKQNFKISAKNNSNQAFTNVKIDFPYPKKTVSGGEITPSVGTWQEWCSGGTQCYTWTIPSLAANTTVTLDVPVYVLDAAGLMSATTHLLSSNPVDNVTVNNSVTILIGAANTALNPPNQLLINSKPIELNGQLNSELNGELNQRIYPTIAENNIVIELKSNGEKQINCQIINALGSVVLNKQLMLEMGINKFNFTVSQLPKGVYFIQNSTGGVPMKFIKM
jgi:hypothetical protein